MVQSTKKFSDLDLNFTPHPNSGDIIPLRNADAVSRAIKNIVLTNFFERPYKPFHGGNVSSFLFENYDPQLRSALKEQITMVIRKFEPRAEVLEVQIQEQINSSEIDKNFMEVSISFAIIGQVEPQTINFILERVR